MEIKHYTPFPILSTTSSLEDTIEVLNNLSEFLNFQNFLDPNLESE